MSGGWELAVALKTHVPLWVMDAMVAPIQTWRKEEGAVLCPCVMHD